MTAWPHTFKQKKANRVFINLHSSKKLAKQFVQTYRQSSLHREKKRVNTTFGSPNLVASHRPTETHTQSWHINVIDYFSYPDYSTVLIAITGKKLVGIPA